MDGDEERDSKEEVRLSTCDSSYHQGKAVQAAARFHP